MNKDYETDGTYLPKAVDRALVDLEEALFSIALGDSSAYRRTVAHEKMRDTLLQWSKEMKTK